MYINHIAETYVKCSFTLHIIVLSPIIFNRFDVLRRKQFFKALRIGLLQELWIELEHRILTVITPHFVVIGFTRADALKPVSNIRIELIVNDGCIWQQDHDVDGKVSEIWILLILEVNEPDIQVAIECIAAKVEAERVVFVHEVIRI